MGVCKIIDFGFAIKTANPLQATFKLRPAGNARWRAPEITARKEYSFSVDVYSFGIVFNEVLTGRRPFNEVERSRTAARKALAGERPYLYQADGSPLIPLIRAAWAQDPDARPLFDAIYEQLTVLLSQLLGPQ